MNHTPTRAGQLLTCPACPWRAVLTSGGRVVQTATGDGGHDHIGQALTLRDREHAERIEYAARVAERLGQRWQSDPHGLGTAELERLWAHIYAEYLP